MIFEAYERWVLERMNPENDAFTTHRERSLNAATGLASEVGEILGVINKLFYRDGRRLREPLIGELGDALFYLVALARQNGLSLSDLARANVDKITARKGLITKPNLGTLDEPAPFFFECVLCKRQGFVSPMEPVKVGTIVNCRCGAQYGFEPIGDKAT